MGTGAITEQIDVALLAFNLFFLFFIGLVAYLHREGKREVERAMKSRNR